MINSRLIERSHQFNDSTIQWFEFELPISQSQSQFKSLNEKLFVEEKLLKAITELSLREKVMIARAES